MLQKRQEQQLELQYKRVQHIRMIQHEQQLLLQARQLQQLTPQNTPPKSKNLNNQNTTQPFPLGTSSSLPLQSQSDTESKDDNNNIQTNNKPKIPKLQPLQINKSVPNTQSSLTAPSTPTGTTTTHSNSSFSNINITHPKMNRSIFDSESPFLKHMRVSLQIWLRVIVDDPLLMISPELSSFIQFRWKYNINNKEERGGIIGGTHDIILSKHELGGILNDTNGRNNMGGDTNNADRIIINKPTLSDFTNYKRLCIKQLI
eukprot:468554_1